MILKHGETVMVKVVSDEASIQKGFIVPAVMTTGGLMLFTPAAGIHLDAEHVRALPGMPLQTVLNQGD